MSLFLNSTETAPTAFDAIFVNPEQRFVAIVSAVSLAIVVGLLICLHTVDMLMSRFKWRWKSNPVSADRRQGLAVLYASSRVAFYIEMGFLVLSAISVSIFIYLAIEVGNRTSDTVREIFQSSWLYWVEFIISACFAAQLIFGFFSAPNLFKFVLNFYTIASLLTIIPGIIGPFIGVYYYFFLNLRVISLLRAQSFLRNYGWAPLQTYASRIAIYWIKIFSTIFCASGFVFVAENSVQNPDGQVRNLLDSVYLMVVTLTTVGYGDIVPKSVLGRIVICVLVLLSISFLPKETARFLKILTSDRTKSVSDKRHVILAAPAGANTAEFLTEFFHEDRLLRSSALCIVSEKDLDPATQSILKIPQYGLRITHIIGDLKNKEDMKRANVGQAEACFLLAKKGQGVTNGDADTILTAMNLMTENDHLKLYIQLMSKQHKTTAKARGVRHVLCVQELRLALLAQNCVFPGIFTFVSNLCRSSTGGGAGFKHNPWLEEYEQGMGFELYSDKDMSSFAGLSLAEAATYIYLKYGCILLGLRVYVGSPAVPILVMNPGSDYQITDIDVGFVIAENEQIVHHLSYENDSYAATAARIVSEKRTPTPTPRFVGRGFAHESDAEGDGDDEERDARHARDEEEKKQRADRSERALARRRSMVIEESDHLAVDPEELEREALRAEKRAEKKRLKQKKRKSENEEVVEKVGLKTARRGNPEPIGIELKDMGPSEADSPELGRKSKKKKQKKGKKADIDDQAAHADPDFDGETQASPEKKDQSRTPRDNILAASRRTPTIVVDDAEPQPSSSDAVSAAASGFLRAGAVVAAAESHLTQRNVSRRVSLDDQEATFIKPPIDLGSSFIGFTRIAADSEMFVEPHIMETCVTVTSQLNTFDRAKRDTVEDELEGHIVLLGIDSSLVDMVTLFRLKSLQQIGAVRPIVILAPDPPSQVVWNSLCVFPDVFYVQGATTIPRDLRRAGVEHAWRVLIFASSSGETSVVSHADAKSILTFRMLKQITKAEVIIELGFAENIRFLSQTSPMLYLPKPEKKSPKQDQSIYEDVKSKYKEIRLGGPLRNPYFAAGDIVVASSLDLLVCQNYFNSDVIRIIERLIQPDSIQLVSFKDLRTQVPEFKDDKDYFTADVFSHFIASDRSILLGLMRKGNGSLGRYLITAPQPTDRIFETDIFFLLRAKRPQLTSLSSVKSSFNLKPRQSSKLSL